MAVKQTLRYTSVDPESTIINFTDWVSGLPDNERAVVQTALTAFTTLETSLVNSGKLAIDFDADAGGKIYTWTNDADAEVGIPEPLIWQTYHQRYLDENNITLEIITETI